MNAKKYNLKVIETSTSIEVFSHEYPVFFDFDSPEKKKCRRSFEELTGPEKINSIARRINYYKNKQAEIRRIIDVNFDNQTCFLTLTQNKDSSIKDDIDIGNQEFQNFMKRLKHYLNKTFPKKALKYVATWELTKKGLIHYHLILFSFPYIDAKVIETIWRHGFIKINKLDHISRATVAFYISKYFTKDLVFKDAKKKAFFKSQNLQIPKEKRLYVPNELMNIDVLFGKPEYTKMYIGRRPDSGVEETVTYYVIPKISLKRGNHND